MARLVSTLAPVAPRRSGRAFGIAMKPTRFQVFFASPWPGRIWFTTIPLAGASAVGVACSTFLTAPSSWWDLVCFAGYVALGLLLGFFLAMFPGWLIIGPLAYSRECKNGGPFQVGDKVQVLCGPHKGRVSRVYSTWQGNTLRVELGAEEKKTFRDVFSPDQLLREPGAEPGASPNGGPAEPSGNSGVGGGPPSVS